MIVKNMTTLFFTILMIINSNLQIKTNNVEIVLNDAENVDSTIKIMGNIANLTLCVRLHSVQKDTKYNLGTCNTYSNHYVRHTGNISVENSVLGFAFITIQPNGIIQFSSSVATSNDCILNDDIMFLTF